MSELLFGLLFAHFFADYLLQTNRINELKNSQVKKEQWKGLLTHTGHHLICYIVIYSIIFLFYKNSSSQIFFTPIIICFIHFWIDFAKVRLIQEKNTLFKAVAYCVDQFLHVVVIYVVLLLITNETHYTTENLVLFLKSLLSNDYNHVLFSLKDKIFLLGAITIITTHFYGYLFEIMLGPFKPSGTFKDTKIEAKLSQNTDAKENKLNEEYSYVVERTDTTTVYSEPPNRTGKYIGMIERLIIVILMTSKAISAIGFLIALKALTRFKQFEDKNFAEYYLIGNLLSVLFGFISSFFAMRILTL